jgi:dolichol kinase
VNAPPDVVATAPPRGLSYGAELKRKALHLSALAYPIGIVLARRPTALAVVIPLALIGLAVDVARQRTDLVRKPFLRVFGSIMRPEEVPTPGAPLVLNGAVWMCVAAALCVLFFPAPIAAAALIMQQMGDAAAAIVGRRFGTIHWPGQRKTLEGSVALAATAFASGWLLAQIPVEGLAAALPVGRLAAGAVAAAVAEALPIPMNDNIRVPLAAGAVMLFVG